jgi:hypothetical protein
MNAKTMIPMACVLLGGLQPLSAQYITGQWNVDAGSGTTVANTSPNNSNWGMTILGSAGLWSYWQPGAYAFANGNNNAKTVVTAAAGWTSGDNLTLKADFNVTGNLHDSGSVFGGGAIFGAGYFTPGGNSLGYNYGAFYATVDTSNPLSPTIKFDASGIGSWSVALPTSVVNPGINGGWNTAEWDISNNSLANSMSLQFRLNGAAVGGAINISGAYLQDFTGRAGYIGSEMYIGAAADQSYLSFRGSIMNVSLTATAVPEPSTLALAGLTGLMSMGLFRRRS